MKDKDKEALRQIISEVEDSHPYKERVIKSYPLPSEDLTMTGPVEVPYGSKSQTENPTRPSLPNIKD